MRHLRIGLIFGTANEADRLASRGVARYAQSHRHWIFHPVSISVGQIASLMRWKPHGVIGVVRSRRMAEALLPAGRKGGVRIVNVLHPQEMPEAAHVYIDEQAVGRMAGQHLIERGLRSLAFVGWKGAAWSSERARGFARAARDAKLPWRHLSIRPVRSGRVADDADVGRWLEAMAKPAGVFAANDEMGFELTELCRRLDLRVPEDVALIGMDNDEQWCSLARPMLSSVMSPAEKVGFTAGRILEHLLDGQAAPPAPVLVAPEGIVARASSDTMAISDPDVLAALRYIRGSVDRLVNVKDVLARVPLSRRALEKRFSRIVGRSPLQEILRVRLDYMKELLSRTDLTVGEVAARCGFSNAHRFSGVFHKYVGLTPTAFRRESRGLAG